MAVMYLPYASHRKTLCIPVFLSSISVGLPNESYDKTLTLSKEVLMANGVIFFLIIGACAADGALWFTALCMICGGVLVHRLNKEDEKNHVFNWDSYDDEYESYD